MKIKLKITIILTALLLLFSTEVSFANAGGYAAVLDSILKRFVSKRDVTDWEAIVLGINGVQIKTQLFSANYFKKVEGEVNKAGGAYRVVTDYARIALAWRCHGKNARNIAGYDFIDSIINFKNMQNQGVNAYIWALIALGGEPDSVTNPLLSSILEYQRPGGGFAAVLPNDSRRDPKAEIDLTAMAVAALAPYCGEKKIAESVSSAISYLSINQLATGGYLANETDNAESICQVIIAVCAAGLDINDPRFVKEGVGLLSSLERFRLRDNTYAHETSLKLKSDPIATRQAALALSAVRRAETYDSLSADERDAKKTKRGVFEF